MSRAVEAHGASSPGTTSQCSAVIPGCERSGQRAQLALAGAWKFLGLSFISVKGTENSKPFQWYQLTP